MILQMIISFGPGAGTDGWTMRASAGFCLILASWRRSRAPPTPGRRRNRRSQAGAPPEVAHDAGRARRRGNAGERAAPSAPVRRRPPARRRHRPILGPPSASAVFSGADRRRRCADVVASSPLPAAAPAPRDAGKTPTIGIGYRRFSFVQVGATPRGSQNGVAASEPFDSLSLDFYPISRLVRFGLSTQYGWQSGQFGSGNGDYFIAQSASLGHAARRSGGDAVRRGLRRRRLHAPLSVRSHRARPPTGSSASTPAPASSSATSATSASRSAICTR